MYQCNSTPFQLYHEKLPHESFSGDYFAWWSLFQPNQLLNVQTVHTDDQETINLLELLTNSIWETLLKLRFLFYLVWPRETMFGSLEQMPRYVAEMFPVFFLTAIIENGVRIWQGRNSIRINETIGSLSQVWNNFRVADLAWDSLLTWWLCYLAVDFGFYWAHRLAHEVNFIWAIHQAHHSSEEFSIVSALRQAVLQPFTAWFTYLPLALFIPPQLFLVHLQLSELYMAWLHTEIIGTIGPLEYILNTPSHHRVHHSKNPEYIDKNYGGMLIIWDRLFNTFKQEDEHNPPVYGLVHPVRGFNPIHVQFHTWPVIWRRIKRTNGFLDKLGVLVKGPGWRPGLPRLGNPEELPVIVRPINSYDPKLGALKNTYVVIHFGILLLFYHEITMHQEQLSSISLNIGVFSLMATIISIGLMLDNKHNYSGICELARCILFVLARNKIAPILDQGLIRSGLSLYYRSTIISIICLIFLLSLIVNSVVIISKCTLAQCRKSSSIHDGKLKSSKKLV